MLTFTILLIGQPVATTNGPISLAGAASLGKYGYGNGTYIGNCPSVNVQQRHCNSHFCWRRELASPAAEV